MLTSSCMERMSYAVCGSVQAEYAYSRSMRAWGAERVLPLSQTNCQSLSSSINIDEEPKMLTVRAGTAAPDLLHPLLLSVSNKLCYSTLLFYSELACFRLIRGADDFIQTVSTHFGNGFTAGGSLPNPITRFSFLSMYKHSTKCLEMRSMTAIE